MSELAPKNCLECGNLFIPRSNAQIYCSRKCRLGASNRRQALRLKDQKALKALEEPRDFGSKNCTECGKIFTLRYVNSTKKTCGKKCRLERRRKLESPRHKNSNDNPREDFSKGKIWVLDEETWTWKKEERK